MMNSLNWWMCAFSEKPPYHGKVAHTRGIFFVLVHCDHVWRIGCLDVVLQVQFTLQRYPQHCVHLCWIKCLQRYPLFDALSLKHWTVLLVEIRYHYARRFYTSSLTIAQMASWSV